MAADPRSTASRHDAYTLLEILIATSILVLLGSGLVALLREGVQLWNRAENQGRLHDQSRVLLDRIAADLRSAVGRSHGGADNAWVRFIADTDPQRRQRLRLVRTISAETSDALLREGGRYLSVRAPAAYDGVNDAWEARNGLLGAPGGLMEVLYAMDPRPGARTVWRGVRSPIGGLDSFFHDRNLAAEVEPERTERRGDVQKSSPTQTDAPANTAVGAVSAAPFRGLARPLTEGVIYLGFSFWGPTTNTWDPSVPPLKEPRPAQKSGPLFRWDSTRALLAEEKGSQPGELVLGRREGSLTDASDDIFPERVEVTAVLRDDSQSRSLSLSEKLAANGTRIVLSRSVSLASEPRDRFLLIDEEWIAVGEVSGREVTVADGGRGARDTERVEHAPGAPVEVGVVFRRVVEVPGHRRCFEDAVEARGAGRR